MFENLGIKSLSKIQTIKSGFSGEFLALNKKEFKVN